VAAFILEVPSKDRLLFKVCSAKALLSGVSLAKVMILGSSTEAVADEAQNRKNNAANTSPCNVVSFIISDSSLFHTG
jgi:hypothetical protein